MLQINRANLVAFAITMPSFSKALKKVNGSLYPFGFLHIFRALKKNDRASFYLIGIDPYLSKQGRNRHFV